MQWQFKIHLSMKENLDAEYTEEPSAFGKVALTQYTCLIIALTFS